MGPSFSSLLLSCLLLHLHTTHASHVGSSHEDVHHRPKRSGNASGGSGDDGASNNENGPSLSIPTWTVAATGAGTSYAQACDSESATYDNILSFGITPTGTVDVYTTSWATTTNYTAPTTRLCDGRTRVVGSLTPVHVGSVLSSNVPTITYTGPEPPCSVQPSDCSWLRKSYLAADSSYSASLTNSPDAPPGIPPTAPRCYIPGPPLEACGQCTIHGGKVELLYFPLSTKTSRDMCATAATSPVICPYGPTRSNDDTVAGFATAPCQYISTEQTSTTDSGPRTVINGTTLYSNRAYISYDTLYATNSCGRVGGTYSNGLVTVASSDVYSVSGYHFVITHAAYPFNFADLTGPVPASAYLAQASCYDSGSPLGDGDVLNGLYAGALGFCSPIIDEAFRPRLAVPPQMRHIDPQFENCLLGLDGLYDPPRLMTSEATLDVPTPFSTTTTTSAVPQQAVTVPQNVATPTADPADSPEQSASPSDAGTEASALSEVASPLSDPAAAAETGTGTAIKGGGGSPSQSDGIDPLGDPTAATETGTVGGGDGGSRSDNDVTNPPSDPTAAMETGMVGGGGGGLRSDNDVTNPPSDPTAVMETQTPQLTTPGADLDPTATDTDASSNSDQSQLSDTSSSRAAEGVSAQSSAAGMQVFPADLSTLVFSCILLICLI